MHEITNSEDIQFLLADVTDTNLFKSLPWGSKKFDVVIPILSNDLLEKESTLIMVEELVRNNSDWFDVLGAKSEWLHDEIDLMGVKVGRQKEVGEGFPMTGWFESIIDIEDMAQHSYEALLSASDFRVVLVIGDSNNYTNFVKEFKIHIAEDCQS